MQLTGKQIIARGIVENYVEEGVQQQGVDVRLKEIYTLDGDGYIPQTGKTIKPTTRPLTPLDVGAYSCWYGYYDKDRDCIAEHAILQPGYYEIEFEESCSIPKNCVLNFKTRSSLVRCGAIVHSGQFDAGFHTKNMGAFLHVIRPITIERGARVAQAVVSESYEVEREDLYEGQWQNDKQRER